MSGIAKPHIFFNTSTTPDVVVNVDNIQTMEKITVNASPLNNNKPEYRIKITMNPINSTTKNIDITFTTLAARNTAFTAAKALIATSV